MLGICNYGSWAEANLQRFLKWLSVALLFQLSHIFATNLSTVSSSIQLTGKELFNHFNSSVNKKVSFGQCVLTFTIALPIPFPLCLGSHMGDSMAFLTLLKVLLLFSHRKGGFKHALCLVSRGRVNVIRSSALAQFKIWNLLRKY